MPHTISDECIACGACEATCEFEAIMAGEEKYTIDAGKCTDCGNCVDACPVEAIAKK